MAKKEVEKKAKEKKDDEVRVKISDEKNKKEDKTPKVEDKESKETDYNLEKKFKKLEREARIEQNMGSKSDEKENSKPFDLMSFINLLFRWIATLLLIIAVLAVIYLLFIYTNKFVSDNFDYVTLTYEPIQCNNNPWEQNWISNNVGDFPRSEEKQIITSYYSTQGVDIKEISITSTKENVCDACDCPRGDEIKVIVFSKDKEKMISFGFKE